jgi:hypothetical protein
MGPRCSANFLRSEHRLDRRAGRQRGGRAAEGHARDVDFTLDGGGSAMPTDRSNVDANLVNWKYHVQHPQLAFETGLPS